MKATLKRLRENYVLLWLFIGVALISFTAGVRTHEKMAMASIAELEAAVKQNVLAKR